VKVGVFEGGIKFDCISKLGDIDGVVEVK
jgi:hypothetical protein